MTLIEAVVQQWSPDHASFDLLPGNALHATETEDAGKRMPMRMQPEGFWLNESRQMGVSTSSV